jgi:single-stranded-DNA-specific exonuclease
MINKGFEKKTIFVETHAIAHELNVKNKNLVLLDIPPSLELLDTLFTHGKPERIYPVFLQESDHFFATIPTREHFKWYYGFLLKKGSFKLKEQGEQLAQHKGWSKETIEFMSQVFFELDFVTIENGVISVNSTSQKRDLAESKTYAQKQMQIELEKTLLYTSYMQLKQWFDERFQSSDVLVNV